MSITESSDLDKTRNVLKHTRMTLNFFIVLIFIFILVFGFVMILLLGDKEYFRNLSSAIQFCVFLTPFLLIYFQIRKDRRRDDDLLFILRNRIQFLINYLHAEYDLGGLTSYDRRISIKIKKYISNLGDFGPKLLNKLKCEIYGIENEILKMFGKYTLSVAGITMNIEGKEVYITKEAELVSKLRNKLDNVYKKRINIM